MELDLAKAGIAAAAAVLAGAVNALAGGGTLVTFPLLTALGLPAVSANVTNTVALCPGYLGAAWAQRSLLRDPVQRRRLALLLPISAACGLVGAGLLLASGERLFRAFVPYLLFLAAILIAVGEPVKRLVARRRGATGGEIGAGAIGTGGDSGAASRGRALGPATAACVGLAAIYGGYFGAGVSVVILAALGIALSDTIIRLNALKQAISLAANLAAAAFFAFSGSVDWIVALAMALGALGGGLLGGRLASRVRPGALRAVVVAVGSIAGLYYLLR